MPNADYVGRHAGVENAIPLPEARKTVRREEVAFLKFAENDEELLRLLGCWRRRWG